jgi:hypothetical protein
MRDLCRQDVRLGGLPNPHVRGRTNGALHIEHRFEFGRVLLGYEAQKVRDRPVDVEGDQDPASQGIAVEERWNIELVRGQELLDQPDESGQQYYFGSLETAVQAENALRAATKMSR